MYPTKEVNLTRELDMNAHSEPMYYITYQLKVSGGVRMFAGYELIDKSVCKLLYISYKTYKAYIIN